MTKVKVVTGSQRNIFEKHKVSFKAGDAIFEEGELGTTMYIIKTGNVEIRKNIGGAEQVLSILEKGDFFGEMSVLEGAPRSASAYAVDDVELIEIDEATFDRMLKANQEIAIRMLRKLSRKLRHTTDLLEQLAGRTLSTEMAAQKPQAASGEAKFILRSVEDDTVTFVISAEGETIVGRKDPVTGIFPAVDLLSLDRHRSVSRHHAKFICDNGELSLKEEVGTMNGTFINGKRLEKGQNYPVSAGDIVQFAAVKLKVELA